MSASTQSSGTDSKRATGTPHQQTAAAPTEEGFQPSRPRHGRPSRAETKTPTQATARPKVGAKAGAKTEAKAGAKTEAKAEPDLVASAAFAKRFRKGLEEPLDQNDVPVRHLLSELAFKCVAMKDSIELFCPARSGEPDWEENQFASRREAFAAMGTDLDASFAVFTYHLTRYHRGSKKSLTKLAKMHRVCAEILSQRDSPVPSAPAPAPDATPAPAPAATPAPATPTPAPVAPAPDDEEEDAFAMATRRGIAREQKDVADRKTAFRLIFDCVERRLRRVHKHLDKSEYDQYRCEAHVVLARDTRSDINHFLRELHADVTRALPFTPLPGVNTVLVNLLNHKHPLNATLFHSLGAYAFAVYRVHKPNWEDHTGGRGGRGGHGGHGGRGQGPGRGRNRPDG